MAEYGPAPEPRPTDLVIPFGSRAKAEQARDQITWAMRQAGLLPFHVHIVTTALAVAGEPSQDRETATTEGASHRRDEEVAAAAVGEPAPPPACICGYLGWTVERYGRITHKQSCPARTDLWHQGDPVGAPAESGEPE